MEQDDREAIARLQAWKPGPEALSLLNELEFYVLAIVSSSKDGNPSCSYWKKEEPYPIKATLVDVITKTNSDGKSRAFLVVKDPVSIPMPDGYDALNEMTAENDTWLFDIANLYEVSMD